MHQFYTVIGFLCVSCILACGSKDNTNQTNNSATSDNSTDSYAQARKNCLDTINAYRATENKPPLSQWVDAETCSDSEAQSDAKSGTSHGAFGQCQEFAQNECPGYPSIAAIAETCLKQMWNEGPGEPFSAHGHYLNMSSTSHTKVACGFYTKSDGTVWAVQNFR